MTQPIDDLSALLSQLSPALADPDFVFCAVPRANERAVLGARLRGTFWEAEGLSVILERAEADRLGFTYTSVHRCITLQVHSSLTAVGLTAAVSSALSSAGISANVVAAYHHDHVFVPAESAETALSVLEALVRA